MQNVDFLTGATFSIESPFQSLTELLIRSHRIHAQFDSDEEAQVNGRGGIQNTRK
jgi:hypothetical protein